MPVLNTLNENTVAERYFLLPEMLQKALGSEDIKSKVDKLAKAAGFEEDAVSALHSVVGEVFLGFVHTDTVGKELEDVLGMDKETAGITSNWLRKEIFDPYREYIDKVYAPTADASLYKSAPPAPPKANMPPPAPLPTITKAGTTGAIPTPPAPPVKINPFAAAPLTPAPIPKPGGAATADVPKPFIIRKEASAGPAVPQFKLDIDPKLFTPTKAPAAGIPVPLRPAQLEFGVVAGKNPGGNVFKSAPDAQRIVHYSDFRTKNIGIQAAPAPIKPGVPQAPPTAPVAPIPKMVDSMSPPQKEAAAPLAAKPPAEPLKPSVWDSQPMPPSPISSAPKAPEPPKIQNFTEGQSGR